VEDPLEGRGGSPTQRPKKREEEKRKKEKKKGERKRKKKRVRRDAFLYASETQILDDVTDE